MSANQISTIANARSAVNVRPLTIALAGNPNAGKTSLFNALTGLRQKVANYPGVTIERKEGVWSLPSISTPARLIDLPGLYSLDANSLDEQIAHDILVGKMAELPAPDVVVVAVDSTNLERNLYLVTQLVEYGRPMVIALTMVDLAEKNGVKLDAKSLSSSFGVPVVAVIARQRKGLDDLAQAVVNAVSGSGPKSNWPLSPAVARELGILAP